MMVERVTNAVLKVKIESIVDRFDEHIKVEEPLLHAMHEGVIQQGVMLSNALDKINDHHKVLYGNGVTGLIKDVDRINNGLRMVVVAIGILGTIMGIAQGAFLLTGCNTQQLSTPMQGTVDARATLMSVPHTPTPTPLAVDTPTPTATTYIVEVTDTPTPTIQEVGELPGIKPGQRVEELGRYTSEEGQYVYREMRVGSEIVRWLAADKAVTTYGWVNDGAGRIWVCLDGETDGRAVFARCREVVLYWDYIQHFGSYEVVEE